ncbi:MAG: UxaA family hydrolase [Geminicoccaceae bacterium]
MVESRGTEFLGCPRPIGRPGTRNHLLILSVTGLTGPSAVRIAARIQPSLCLGTPYGSGLLGVDRAAHDTVLEGFVTHPNVGAVLVIGADPPQVEAIGNAAARAGRAVEALSLDASGHDALTLVDRGTRAAARLLRDLSRQRRQLLPMRELFLALECGRSDPSSGLAANPLVGMISDRVVEEGGVAVIGETTEWLGAEQCLTRRAETPEVAEAIDAAARRREAMAVAAGINLIGNNPSQTNVDAGLSTIEEKSLGAIAKSGRAPIAGVLTYGEAPAGPGLWLMDAPAYAPESLTGFAASGANLALFTTGVGNSYSSALMPTIKLSANPETAARIAQQLDFDANSILTGKEVLGEAAARLLALMLDIASGSLTWAEILGDHGETISRFGEAL